MTISQNFTRIRRIWKIFTEYPHASIHKGNRQQSKDACVGFGRRRPFGRLEKPPQAQQWPPLRKSRFFHLLVSTHLRGRARVRNWTFDRHRSFMGGTGSRTRLDPSDKYFSRGTLFTQFFTQGGAARVYDFPWSVKDFHHSMWPSDRNWFLIPQWGVPNFLLINHESLSNGHPKRYKNFFFRWIFVNTTHFGSQSWLVWWANKFFGLNYK